MGTWLFGLDPRVQAALIAAVVGVLSSTGAVLAKFFLDKRSLRHRLATEFEYEQRKKLQAAVGEHLGQILERAERWDHRLWNLQRNEAKGWLDVSGNYQQSAYYFRSTVYRFLDLFAAVRSFLDAAVYVDRRYASGNDQYFLGQLKALEWAMTDVVLFDGTGYDDFSEVDHIFRGTLHKASHWFANDGAPVTPTEFDAVLNSGVHPDSPLPPILEFFDGLQRDEGRYRWDRMVVLHLLLMGFLATFGYDVQRPALKQFHEIARTLKTPSIAEQFGRWLPKLGLTPHPSGLAIQHALKAAFPSVTGPGIFRTMEVEKFLPRG